MQEHERCRQEKHNGTSSDAHHFAGMQAPRFDGLSSTGTGADDRPPRPPPPSDRRPPHLGLLARLQDHPHQDIRLATLVALRQLPPLPLVSTYCFRADLFARIPDLPPIGCLALHPDHAPSSHGSTVRPFHGHHRAGTLASSPPPSSRQWKVHGPRRLALSPEHTTPPCSALLYATAWN